MPGPYRAHPMKLSTAEGFFASNPVARIVGMTASPEDFEPERLADQFSTTKTATASPKDNFQMQWGTAGQPDYGTDLTSTDTGIFMFRDPVRHTVIYTVAGDSVGRWQAWSAVYPEIIGQLTPGYKLAANDEQDLCDTAFWQAYTGKTLPDAPTLNPPGPPATPIVTVPSTAEQWSPSGNFIYSGVGKDQRGVWVDAPANGTNSTRSFFIIRFPATTQTADATNRLCLTLNRWNGSSWEYQDQVHIPGTALTTGGSIALYVKGGPNNRTFGSGYYNVEANLITPATEIIMYDIVLNMQLYTETNSAFAHRAIRDINPATVGSLKMNAIRILGESLLVKNVASPLNQQGALVALQASDRTDWFETYVKGQGTGALGPGSGFYNYLFSQADERDFRLANGYYGWVKPGGVQDYEWSTNIKLGNTALLYGGVGAVSIQFELSPKSEYLVFAAATTNPQGGDCLGKTSVAMEWKSTSSMLIQTEQPTATIADWEAARAIIKSMIQHWENPTHLGSILAQILGSVGKVASVSAPVLGLVPGIGSVLSAGARGVERGAKYLGGVVSGVNDFTDRLEPVTAEIREQRRAITRAIQGDEQAAASKRVKRI